MRWYILGSDDDVIIVDIEDGPEGLSNDDLLRITGGIQESLSFSSSR